MSETVSMSIREAAKSVPCDVELMREWVYSDRIPYTHRGTKKKRRYPLRDGFREAVARIQSGRVHNIP